MDLKELLKTFPKEFEELKIFRNYLIFQIKVLEEFFFPFQANDKNSRIFNLIFLLERISSECKAVVNLLPGGFVSESYILARSTLEKSINYCYLLVCDEEEYKNYMDYSKQKMVRSFYSKERAFGHLGIKKELPDIALLSSYHPLKKFTGPRGGEKTRWTEKNLEDRIKKVQEIVDNFTSQIYLVALNYIYEDASESLHGTLYGAIFHTGIFGAASSAKEGYRFLIGLGMNLCMLLGLIINEILVVTDHDVKIPEIVKSSQENYSKTIGKLYKNGNLPKGEGIK
jgi:hypothetical protein